MALCYVRMSCIYIFSSTRIWIKISSV